MIITFKIRNHYYINAWIIGMLCLILYSCDRDRKHTGYVYFPDMVESKAYETYNSNTNFKDGKTAQLPQPGTIPRETIPYQYPKSDKGLTQAGLELINPIELNEENLARGKKEYEIFCSMCHGSDGRGEGILYKSGKYPTEPTSLISEDMLQKPAGEFYHIITLGSVIMQAHASQIRPEDRWKLILYIKHDLQKKQNETTN